MKLPQHGSNPQYVYEEIGIEQPDRLIDLSANINPLGPPSSIEKNWLNFFQRMNDYPDPYTSRLKEVIASKEKVEMESILVGNGGAELIYLIARVLSGKNVLIIEPTFSEYEKACKANECHIFYHTLKEPDWKLRPEELNVNEMDAVFLCNPNNPTGVFYPYETMVDVVKACRETNTLLIIDEAFYDFVAEYESLTPLLDDYQNLVILRSMTKMFAIPGIRLGYVLADPLITSKMSRYQAHWSVNALAMEVGELCLQEETFVDQTLRYMEKERETLFSFFSKEGFDTSPSRVNFYLLRDPNHEAILPLYTFLLERGIVPRHTVNFPGLEGKWLRFAIKRHEENVQLMEALREWKSRT